MLILSELVRRNYTPKRQRLSIVIALLGFSKMEKISRYRLTFWASPSNREFAKNQTVRNFGDFDRLSVGRARRKSLEN
jgi:hypothetical protein